MRGVRSCAHFRESTFNVRFWKWVPLCEGVQLGKQGALPPGTRVNAWKCLPEWNAPHHFHPSKRIYDLGVHMVLNIPDCVMDCLTLIFFAFIARQVKIHLSHQLRPTPQLNTRLFCTKQWCGQFWSYHWNSGPPKKTGCGTPQPRSALSGNHLQWSLISTGNWENSSTKAVTPAKMSIQSLLTHRKNAKPKSTFAWKLHSCVIWCWRKWE